MDPKVADFIRANRGRYTREAIIGRLVEAGHDRAEAEWTWDRLAEAEPQPGPSGKALGWYVWIVYVLGFVGILLIGLNLGPFLVGWLVAYGLIAIWPAIWLARQQPGSTLGTIAVVVAAPIIVVLIGGGICFATIVVVMSTLSF